MTWSTSPSVDVRLRLGEPFQASTPVGRCRVAQPPEALIVAAERYDVLQRKREVLARRRHVRVLPVEDADRFGALPDQVPRSVVAVTDDLCASPVRVEPSAQTMGLAPPLALSFGPS
jgi:hypothetical protein